MSTEDRQATGVAVHLERQQSRSHRRALPLVALLAVLATALLYQIPATHPVDVGAYDAAYTRGFHDPERSSEYSNPPAFLHGSNGSARWSRASSFLVFPLSGQPATVSLRLRGWRPDGAAVPVQVLLNGRQELGRFEAGPDWQEYEFAIEGGLLKASDFFVEIRSATFRLPGDERELGVLVDQAEYRVAAGPAGLIWPYPSQLIFAGLAARLIWLLLNRQRARWRPVAYIGLALAFLLLYRLQPPLYPYPLRWLLPGLLLLLAGLLLLRLAPLLPTRPALLRWSALAVTLIWVALLLRAQQQHVTLSLPGVEGDFRVFALRSVQLFGTFNPSGEYNVANDGVLRADGFYNLGYPLLLWALRPLSADNPFLAARLIAVFSAVLLLGAGYLLAYRVLPERLDSAARNAAALCALLLLAFSPLVVQYGLYLGSDMPFAALSTMAIALLVGRQNQSLRGVALAGFVAGCAFLVRHLGLLLLLWGLAYCFLTADTRSRRWRLSLAFGLAFMVAAAPQLIVNTLQTGQPLFNQQAKNAWLAIYGGTDWERWAQVNNSIGLREIVLRDPARFLSNWWHNVVAFVGQGAEQPGELGRADQLRLLAFPANWLAVIGLLAAAGNWRRNRPNALPLALLAFVALYVAVLSIAFTLLRFYLPLAPIYAAGAAWLLALLVERIAAASAAERMRNWLAVVLLILLLLGGQFANGTRYVLDNQSAGLVSVVRMVESEIPADAVMVARTQAGSPIAKYSAIAHRVVEWPAAADDTAALQIAVAQGIPYLLWDQDLGLPPLPDPATPPFASAGGYALYRLE